MTWNRLLLIRLYIMAIAFCAAVTVSPAATNYVSLSGSHTTPFDTWAKAATNIHDALALAGDNDTVLISNGVFTVTNQLELATGITLRGVNGSQYVTLNRPAAAGNYRLLYLTSSNALVEGVTVNNGYGAQYGGGVRMTDGTMRDCVISNCSVETISSIGRGGGVYMNAGALDGCTIHDCQGRESGGLYAVAGTVDDCVVSDCSSTYIYGGIYVKNATLRRCRVFGNSAPYYGGGGYVDGASARVENCLFYSNNVTGGGTIQSAFGGGIGMGAGTVENCTFAYNTVADGSPGGGGLYRQNGVGIVRNCIIYHNKNGALDSDCGGVSGGISFSCASDLTAGVDGNISTDPYFVSDADYHLRPESPCLDIGTNLVSITNDIDRAVRPLIGNSGGTVKHDMGAYEKEGTNGTLEVGFSASPVSGMNSVESVFTAYSAGTDSTITWYGWDFENDGTNNLAGTGLAIVTNTYGLGLYSVSLSVSNGSAESASCTKQNYILVSSTNIYVSTNGSPVFPYVTWATAATNVSAAIDAAIDGSIVHITNGTHMLTDQLVVSKAITVQGVNGAQNTILERDDGAGNFRIFTVDHTNAVIKDLTISKGYLSSMGAGVFLRAGMVRDCIVTNCEAAGGNGTGGGGIRVNGGSSVVSNCVVVDCRATASSQVGGGIWMTGGTLLNSTIRDCLGNQGAGIYVTAATVEDCTIRDCTSTYIHGSYANNSSIRRCTFYNNTAVYWGGAINVLGSSLLENCLMYSNSITGGGGSAVGGGLRLQGGAVVNCTIADNSVTTAGGGVHRSGGYVTNCIIYNNTRGEVSDDYYGDISFARYSCAIELTNAANGNVPSVPRFVDAPADYHLLAESPCLDSGTNLVSITNDIDMTVRPLAGNSEGVMRHDMGVYEKEGTNGSLEAGFTVSPLSGLDSVECVFTSYSAGTDAAITWYGWDFDNDGTNELEGVGLSVVTNTYTPGVYSVSLSVSNGSSESASSIRASYIQVSSTEIYVSTNGSHTFPYGSWAAAATNLNDALSAAVGGCTIHVSNGTFLVTNQLSLTEEITVRGENGAQNTIVERDAAAGNFRVFLMDHADAVVEGLTISKGYVTTFGGGIYLLAGTVRDCVVTNCEASGGAGVDGGGIRMLGGTVTNTLIVDCRAASSSQQGGGVWMNGGTLLNSTIRACRGNQGAGMYVTAATVKDCMIYDCISPYIHGSYANNSTVRRCTFYNNTAAYWGGGINIAGSSLLENCLVYSNSITGGGGSAVGGGVRMQGGRVVNCTIADNSATTSGGGISRSAGYITNSIVYYNTAASGNNYDGDIAAAAYSCASELTNPGNGNITNAPLFKDRANYDYRLEGLSPCVNAGINLSGMENDTDLDGNDRILKTTVDMGAYETMPAGGTVIVIR